MTEVLGDAPAARCPHAAECPGCPEIARPIAAQREAKRSAVVRALERFGMAGVDATVGVGPIESYRTRAKLMVDVRRGRLGLYREGTHDVIDVPGCRVLAAAIADAARAIRERIGDPRLRELRAVDLREVAAEGPARALVTLVFDRDRAPSADEARAIAGELAGSCASIASIAINLRARGPQVLGDETRVLLGPAALRDRIGEGAPYVLATHGSFVQAHRGAAAAIHDAVLGAIAPLGRAPRVIELFAGSGALALRMAAEGARVHAIESFAPAIERARRAAEEQGIEGLSIAAADAEGALAALARAGERADAIVLDPPRRGAPPELRAAIAALAPSRVIYVSCDPETLARDLAHLARLGLAPERVTPFDLMPLTSHVETVAVLAPAAPPAARVLFEDERLIVVAKDAHEPTTPHPEHATSTLARVQALAGAEHAAPVHRLDRGTSGVCLFARRPEQVAPIAAALAAGRKSYLALVRGVTHAKGIVRRPLEREGRALDATTRFSRRAVVGGHALVRAAPQEGRLHQIRRHLASIGHPVLGDPRYGHAPSNRHLWERAALDRPFLHCERIELPLAGRAAPLVLEAPLAPDLALVLERLRARPPRSRDA